MRELKRQSASPFVFASERCGPFTPSGFAKQLLARAGSEAKIDQLADPRSPINRRKQKKWPLSRPDM